MSGASTEALKYRHPRLLRAYLFHIRLRLRSIRKKRSWQRLRAAICYPFPGFAARQGFVIDHYLDEAIGSTSRNDHDKLYVSEIVLSPDVTFGGSKQPSKHELDTLHHRAHEECYIANSVKAEIIVRPKRLDQARERKNARKQQ